MPSRGSSAFWSDMDMAKTPRVSASPHPEDRGGQAWDRNYAEMLSAVNRGVIASASNEMRQKTAPAQFTPADPSVRGCIPWGLLTDTN